MGLSEDQEVVLLAKVLASEVNYGFEDFACLQLMEFGRYSESGGHSVAGKMTKVQSLRHLRNLVLEANTGYFRFRLANELEVILDAAECEAAGPEILRQHAIPRDCSDDLLSLPRHTSANGTSTDASSLS